MNRHRRPNCFRGCDKQAVQKIFNMVRWRVRVSSCRSEGWVPPPLPKAYFLGALGIGICNIFGFRPDPARPGLARHGTPNLGNLELWLLNRPSRHHTLLSLIILVHPIAKGRRKSCVFESDLRSLACHNFKKRSAIARMSQCVISRTIDSSSRVLIACC